MIAFSYLIINNQSEFQSYHQTDPGALINILVREHNTYDRVDYS